MDFALDIADSVTANQRIQTPVIRLLNLATDIRQAPPGDSRWEMRLLRAMDYVQRALFELRNPIEMP